MDYYELLGVSKSATNAEIKTAYRKQALKWHPDRNKTSEAESKFKEVTQAYEVLSDTSKKSQYDQFGHSAYTQNGFGRGQAGGGNGAYSQGPFQYTYSSSEGGNPFEGFGGSGFSDPFEIFEQFFGFRSPGGQTARKQVYQLNISFNDVVHGATKTVSINGKNKTIKIPAGVDDGMRMRFTDFDVIFAVSSDKKFERRGQDIISHVKLPFTTAILGGEIAVETIDGKTVKLKVKQGTQLGTIMRLKDKGLPHVNSNRHGDHYVAYDITLPDRLTNRQKELLKEFEDE